MMRINLPGLMVICADGGMLLGLDDNIVHTFGFTFGKPTNDAGEGYMLLLEVTTWFHLAAVARAAACT